MARQNKKRMEQLIDFLKNLGDSEAFMPRWVCGEWSELHGWVYIISDLIIFLAYMAIPTTMLIFVRKRWHDVPFKPVFWLYILFILFCGITHLIDAVIFYEPIYRINAVVLAMTAVVSMVTVGAMIHVLPKALAFKSPKELERVVDRKTVELKDQVTELNKLSDSISRKKEQLEQFAYITSHNLRSPAANLHSLMEMVRTTEDPDEREEILGKIGQSAESLLNTINDVSSVVKESTVRSDAVEVSFKQIIDEVLACHEQELDPLNTTIEMDLQVERMIYPPDHFRNIIQNLIDNAVRYRKPNAPFQLKLRTRMENGSVVFECEDNGIGIDMKKDGDRVFKLYSRLNRNSEGKGIGLFLVQNQLESLNGIITLSSEPGKGARFTVVFGELNDET